MKRMILFLGFFLLITVGFATTVSFKLNEVCKNDAKLLLKEVQLTDDATIISFLYTNDDTKNKTIGVFSPNSANSMFLYNQDGTKIYYLKDMTKLPKWWPQKKYVLNKGEKLEFQLIFEKIDPTLKINIVEGKNNFKALSGWIFLDVPVNSYNFLAKNTIELLKKSNLSEKDQIVLNSYREYNFVNDFISYFKNKSQNIKAIYLTKWKNNPKASGFIDFILSEDAEQILENNDMNKALEFISKYPNAFAIKNLKKRMEPVIQKEIQTDYNLIKDSNSPKEYITFINKYLKYKKDFPNITYVDDIQSRLNSFIKSKKEELMSKNDPDLYNTFFKKYGSTGAIKAIFDDYQNMAKQEYINVELKNTPDIWEKFLQHYPYSTYSKSVHKKFYNYFRNHPDDIELITKYIGEYPNSPYLNEIIQNMPQTTLMSDSADSVKTEQNVIPKKQMTLEERVEAFKNSLKKGDILHYREKTTVSNPNVGGGKERYVAIYEVKVLNVLKTTLRVEIVNVILADQNPSQEVLSGFTDLKDVMIGTIEKREFQKFDEFKNF